MDSDKIKVGLATKIIGKEVIVYTTTASTNDVAAEYARGGSKNNGLVIFSEYQTAGKGRRGNQWVSQPGMSILCSILLTDRPVAAELVTLASAVAVAETIGRCGQNEAKIKWPNDIILNDKKVAGILLESINISGSEAYVLGVGINCHQNKRSFAGELGEIATSIDIESHRCCDRISLARRLLTYLDQWIGADSQNIIDRWRQLSTLLGHRIAVEFDGRQFRGNCIGIDPAEGLILQLERGGVRMFDAAHTTIVK